LIAVVFAWVGADARSPWVWSLIGVAMAREVGVTVLRFHSARYGRIVPASSLGRWKMFMQSCSGLLILSSAHILGRPVPVWVVVAALLAALAVSVASALGYVGTWRQQRIDAAAPPIRPLHTNVERVASGG
jgi:phosphatidylglycerophosphate synthase